MDEKTDHGTNDTAPVSEEAIRAKLDAPCELRVRRQGERCLVGIPELGLYASGKELPALEAELMEARERRIREYAAEGILDWLPEPSAASSGGPQKPSLLAQLKVFLIKAAVVTALFLGAVNVISGGLRDIGYVLEKKLDSVTSMTPESVEKHRAKAARITEKLRPIVREVLVLFEAPAAAAPRPAAAGNNTDKP